MTALKSILSVGVSSDAVVRFARAVLKPRDVRLYALDGSNALSDEWVSIGQAVASGRPFAGEVADDIFVFDADTRFQNAALDLIAESLRQHSIVPVIVNSGGLERRHLFAHIASVTLKDWITKRAHELAGDKTVAPSRRLIRPPLSPHRSGNSGSLITPSTIEEAIRALQPTISRFEPRVSRQMLELLRNGDTTGRYAKGGSKTHRDHAIQAFITSTVGAGWTRYQTWRVLMKESNKLAEKWRQMSVAEARRRFERSWKAARQLVRSCPPVSRRVDVMRFVEEVVQSLIRFGLRCFRGRAAKSAFAVFCAHLNTAHRLGRLEYTLSERQISEFSRAQKRDTVRRANEWLERRKLITRLNPPSRSYGISRFKLEVTPSAFDAHEPSAAIAAETEYGPFSSFTLNEIEESGSTDWAEYRFYYDPSLRPLPEVFAAARRGLGFATMFAWIVADRVSSAEIATRLGISEIAVSRHLHQLKRVGLMVRDGTSWQAIRIPDVLDAAAHELGTFGSRKLQREHNVTERVRFMTRGRPRRDLPHESSTPRPLSSCSPKCR
jgi:hypothetical protein